METKKYIESIGQAYKQVQEKKKMDPVDKGELKGKHADRDDKDIDNDGDVDGTDKYLHKRRKAVSKAMDEDHGKLPSMDHVQDMCDKGMSTAEMLKMHPDCDQEELKAMIKKCRDKMDEEAGCSTDRKKTRKEDEEIVMNPKKKKEKGEKAMSSDSNMSQENTKWPIYQRIMEKNVVNQNAVPPQAMIPAEKQLKDHEAEVVNQSQDHISAAAAQWIKDHDGNQKPDDAVDHEKIVAKNAQDAMRTVPNQAKDEVNKKAAKAEPMKKVEEK